MISMHTAHAASSEASFKRHVFLVDDDAVVAVDDAVDDDDAVVVSAISSR
jgi:hypothetical protein